MDQNPQQPTSEAPPTSAADPMGAPMPANYPRPMGGMVSQDERTQAMLAWILSIPLGFISGLIFFLISKDKPFVYRHAAQALTLTLAVNIIMIVLVMTVVGIILAPFVGLFGLIICIMAALAANKGEEYNPPITSGLAKSMFKI